MEKLRNAMIEHLRDEGFTVLEPGQSLPVETARHAELATILYRDGERYEFDGDLTKELYAGYSDIYREVFQSLDLDRLVQTWDLRSLSAVSSAGKTIQIAPTLADAADLRKAARSRLERLGPSRSTPKNHGMNARGFQN